MVFNKLTQLRKSLSAAVNPAVRARIIGLEFAFKQKLRRTPIAGLVRPHLMRQYLRRPEEIDIEVTSVCDADCIMCPRRSMSRRPEAMPMPLFQKIVDQAIELEVPKLVLNGYGEISVLKEYAEYLSYIRRKSETVTIVVNTNGMRMDEDLRRAYLDFRIDVVNVTIDGATAETYENIRRNLKLEQVESNVRELLKARNESGARYPYVGVFMIAMDRNRHECDLFERKWKGVADHVGFTGLVSRIDSVAFAKAGDSGWQNTPCVYLWNQMPILSDGSVALCCDDWNGRGALGNIKTSSLEDLWQHPERSRIRLAHLAGKSSTVSLCAGCRQPRKGPWWFNSDD